MILVESAPRRIDGAVAFIGLGHEHHQGMGQASTGLDQEREHLIEGRRVAHALEIQGQGLGQIGAEDAAPHPRLARFHPVEFPLQGVDLAIVRQQVKRLSQSPVRKRVGAVAAVHQGQGRLQP